MAANEYLSDMELETKIKCFTPEGQFLAREQYKLRQEFADLKKSCIACNPGKVQSLYNASGMIGFITAVIVGVLNWVTGK
jgi:hypothetical protein